MSNRNRGEVTVRLDRTRTLKYDLNAMAEFEDQAGMSIIDALQSFQDSNGNPTLSLKIIRSLLWAGLLHEDENLTIKKVGQFFDDYVEGDGLIEKLTKVFTPISEAVFESFGDKEAKKKFQETKERLQEESTGTNSSE